MNCPICSKKFTQSTIEEHVEFCLTRENKDIETHESRQTKRTFSYIEDSGKRLEKKRKIENTEQSNSKKNNFLTYQSNARNTRTKQENYKNSNSNVNEMNFKSNSKNNFVDLKKGEYVPLAEKLRPSDLSNYIGQKKLLGSQTVLGRLLENMEIPSMILSGPPGCGKTSLAHVIANMAKNNSEGKTKFLKLSATSSGISDIREAVTSASRDLKLGIKTIVFMDEIHRFNKLQQDIFLPHVESGTFVLIGATTENPSFSLNSALLSRCRVFVFERLENEDIHTILEKGIEFLGGQLRKGKREMSDEFCAKSSDVKFIIYEDALNWLVEASNGDARVALGGLEIAAKSCIGNSSLERRNLSLKELKNGLEKIHILSERKCDLNFDVITAMQKSVGAGDENASLYWLARLMAGGEDPVYIARRLIRVASENVSFDDPEALDIAVQTMHACQMIGMPECDVMLGQCAVYLARACKSRSVEDALRKAQNIVDQQKGPQPSVPLHIRCALGERKLQASLDAADFRAKLFYPRPETPENEVTFMKPLRLDDWNTKFLSGSGVIDLVRKKEESKNRLPAGLENLQLFN